MSLDTGAGLPPAAEPSPAEGSRYRISRLQLCVGLFAAALLVITLLTEPVLAIPLLLIPPVVLYAQRSPRDAVSVLTVFLVLLFVVPSNLVIGPLGSAGRPASVFGLICLWWWAHDRLLPDSKEARGLQPVRLAAFGLAASFTASYVAAFTRPIDGVESSAADRNLLYLFGMLGVVLLASDGILERERLDTFLRRLVGACTGLALVGILQFGGIDVSGVFQLPFLTAHSDFQGVQIRSDLRRVAGTSTHPIEFGVVLALVLPVALHYALHAKQYRRTAWIPVVLIAIGIPLSVSRSGTLAAMITFGAMWFTWDRQLRIRSAVAGSVLIVAMRFAVPGLIGTIKSLFTNLGHDDSVDGRTSDYAEVGRFFNQSPFVGRGFGTLLPDRYLLLDNQYLGTLIETGVVGIVALIAFFVVVFATARGARRGGDPETRSLGQALAAAVLGAVVAAGTFDFLGFTQATGVLVIVAGCAGAIWRLQTSQREAASAAWARASSPKR